MAGPLIPVDAAPLAPLDVALGRWRDLPSPASQAAVLAALPGATLYVAVTTAAGSGSGQAELSVVSLLAASGARALVAFTDPVRLTAWRAGLRPVVLPAREVCAGALSDGAAALLLDPDRRAFEIGRADLAELAHGRIPVAGAALSVHAAELTGPSGTADPALVAALSVALDDEPVRSARLLAGPDGPVLGVVPGDPLGASDLAALGARLRTRLLPVLPAGGLDLAVVPAHGPGTPVPLARRRWRRRRR